jgi:hypothetical protein
MSVISISLIMCAWTVLISADGSSLAIAACSENKQKIGKIRMMKVADSVKKAHPNNAAILAEAKTALGHM